MQRRVSRAGWRNTVGGSEALQSSCRCMLIVANSDRVGLIAMMGGVTER